VTLDYRVREPAGEPEGVLVLFHGRGADEHDLFPLLGVLDPDRRLLGLTPRGPLALPPGGAHWYELYRVGHPDPPTFRLIYARAAQWLQAIAAETEIPPERIVLGGFSQGAVMAYALAFGPGRPRPAAVIALSGFIPIVPGFELDLDPPLPPVAIGHGTYDDVIPVEWGRRARALLEHHGAEVLYTESRMPHTIDPRFAVRLQSWLADVLAVPAGH
jgi:phospholipase/carboxylesterase